MGWNVEDTKITLTRGDSFRCQFPMYVAEDETDEGTLYDLQPGDVVRFALKADYDDDEPLITKPLKGYTLTLAPSDTEGLEFGTYYYDVYITKADGWRQTYIEKAKFKISQEVHRKWL